MVSTDGRDGLHHRLDDVWTTGVDGVHDRGDQFDDRVDGVQRPA